MEIILASSSSGRSALLSQTGLSFRTVHPPAKEVETAENAETLVRINAEKKAQSILPLIKNRQ